MFAWITGSKNSGEAVTILMSKSPLPEVSKVSQISSISVYDRCGRIFVTKLDFGSLSLRRFSKKTKEVKRVFLSLADFSD